MIGALTVVFLAWTNFTWEIRRIEKTANKKALIMIFVFIQAIDIREKTMSQLGESDSKNIKIRQIKIWPFMARRGIGCKILRFQEIQHQTGYQSL